MRRRVKRWLRAMAARVLREEGWAPLEAFTRPYIIEKNIEGAAFLFHITDQSARSWYDLHAGDPDWIEMRFIRDHLLSPGDLVLEAGSHHGCTALAMAQWVGPDGRIIAYEPDRRNFDVLRRNLSLNRVENVTPINMAVGDVEAMVAFLEVREESMGGRVAPDAGGDFEVGQIPLDSHFDEAPALIKIDTQGYVYEPLKGAERLLREQRPHLALEIDGRSEIEEYGDHFDAIFELIDHADYEYHVQFEDETREVRPMSSLTAAYETWQAKDTFRSVIHLFAKNTKRQS